MICCFQAWWSHIMFRRKTTFSTVLSSKQVFIHSVCLSTSFKSSIHYSSLMIRFSVIFIDFPSFKFYKCILLIFYIYLPFLIKLLALFLLSIHVFMILRSCFLFQIIFFIHSQNSFCSLFYKFWWNYKKN